MIAIELTQTGGPEVLTIVDKPTPKPGPGEVLVRNQAIGVNFIDTYLRSGLYPLTLPSGLGSEAAGVVEAMGEGVADFAPGDRVAYGQVAQGAYAQFHAVPAARLVRLPSHIDAEIAAACLLKGMTVEFLLTRCVRIEPGDVILVHAAAGGVGSIMVQWAKAIGAIVIATVGSQPKAQLARANGADHIILYGAEDVAAKVAEITGGRGVRAVYDSVGQATIDGSIASLARRGTLVSFGNASGPPPAIDPLRLMRAGSLYLTRPTLNDYVVTAQELAASARALFDKIGAGAVKIQIGRRFALADAAEAHRALQSRQTTGSTILIP